MAGSISGGRPVNRILNAAGLCETLGRMIPKVQNYELAGKEYPLVSCVKAWRIADRSKVFVILAPILEKSLAAVRELESFAEDVHSDKE